LAALKPFPQTIPILNEKGICGFTNKMNDIPKNTEPIGDFP